MADFNGFTVTAAIGNPDELPSYMAKGNGDDGKGGIVCFPTYNSINYS
jgi:hypothetical protein